MQTPQETIEMMSKFGTENVENLRQLGELQMKTWNQMLDKQLEIFNTLTSKTAEQVKVVTESKNLEDAVRGQTEINRSLLEEMMGKTRESIEMAQQAGEEYRTWAEKSLQTAKQQVETATPANV